MALFGSKSRPKSLIIADERTHQAYKAHIPQESSQDFTCEINFFTTHSPKRVNLLLAAQIPHFRLELHKNMLPPKALTQNFWLEGLERVLYEMIASELGLVCEDFARAPYLYRVYCVPLAHDFDDDKFYLECFIFSALDEDFNAQNAYRKAIGEVISSDIFLPLTLFHLPSSLQIPSVPKAFIVWIDRHICYFENGALRDIKALHSIDSDISELSTETHAAIHAILHEISLHVNALKLAHSLECDEIYHFLALDMKQSFPTALRLTPLQSLTPCFKHLSHEEFRLHLALFYYQSCLDSQSLAAYTFQNLPHDVSHDTPQNMPPHPTLPNFAPKKAFQSPLLYTLLGVLVLFMLAIPLALFIYANALQNSLEGDLEQIYSAQTHFQTQPPEGLDMSESTQLDSLTHDQNALSRSLLSLQAWQEGYLARYEFMSEILEYIHVDSEAHRDIRIDDISFYFTPQSLIATLKVSASSQLPLSTFYAQLNVTNHTLMMTHSESSLGFGAIIMLSRVLQDKGDKEAKKSDVQGGTQ